jgi:hypothetical protein
LPRRDDGGACAQIPLVKRVNPSHRQSKELFGKGPRSCLICLRDLEALEEFDQDNRLSCTLRSGSRIVSLPRNAKIACGFSTSVIEDEAAYVSDELYTAISPMLAVSTGRLILMSTPGSNQLHFLRFGSTAGLPTTIEGGYGLHGGELPLMMCFSSSRFFQYFIAVYNLSLDHKWR